MRSSHRSGWVAFMALAACLQGPLSAAGEADFDQELQGIESAWDHANFDPAPSAEARRSTLEQLTARAAEFTRRYPDRAEPRIWEGIILSSYAGAKGGLGALGLAKRSRERLLAALAISPEVLNGSAYTSLGALYFKVPGFPLGFGNHDKAREYLNKALTLNPRGIDPNFFYGELLFEDGHYAEALQYLERAQQAPPRPGREVADEGRRREIAALLERTRALESGQS